MNNKFKPIWFLRFQKVLLTKPVKFLIILVKQIVHPASLYKLAGVKDMLNQLGSKHS